MIRKYFYDLANDDTRGITASLLKFLLYLLSIIYFLLVRLLVYCYQQNIFKRVRLDCKVISVGNITWGGTGKTPIVEMIAEKLLQEGHKVAIQSRGYGKKTQNYKEIGDEPSMLKNNLDNIPIIVGNNRAQSARLACDRLNLDTIILDDGFQHWKIFRDLDIVVIDATNPFGCGYLIPRGILRESLSSLKRADIFFLTHTDLAGQNIQTIIQKINKINPASPVIECAHAPVGFYNILDDNRNITELNALKNKNCCLVTAIGNPNAFLNTLLKVGITCSLKFVFLDHYEFLKDDFDRIIRQCVKENITTIITTQKDAARLRNCCLGVVGFEILALKIKIKITKNEDVFLDRLLSLYRG